MGIHLETHSMLPNFTQKESEQRVMTLNCTLNWLESICPSPILQGSSTSDPGPREARGPQLDPHFFLGSGSIIPCDRHSRVLLRSGLFKTLLLHKSKLKNQALLSNVSKMSQFGKSKEMASPFALRALKIYQTQTNHVALRDGCW